MVDIDLKVFSPNCNGWHDNVKRTATMQNLKSKDPVFTYFKKPTVLVNRNLPGQLLGVVELYIFSHGTSNSRGVAILITSNYDIKVHNVLKDEYGRFLILDIERNGAKYTNGNIYMPTRNHETEQRDTFAQFTAELDKVENEHVIIGGDYNVYVNPALDKMEGMGENSDNGNFRLDLTSYLDVNNLVDVWRIAHPDTKFFTWHRGSKRARLDYTFISEHLLNCVDATDIRPGILSDHSL